MSTPINDFQDILDAMERNPALAKELRRHVLTDELLHVPAALLAFMEEQRKFNEDMTSRMTNVETRLTRLTRIEGDFGTTKGYYARNIAANDAAGMADDMGMTLVRTLSIDNLREMIQGHPMEIQTRRSFRNADLVMEAATPRRRDAVHRRGSLLHRRPEGFGQSHEERINPERDYGENRNAGGGQRQEHPGGPRTGGIGDTPLASVGGPDVGGRVGTPPGRVNPSTTKIPAGFRRGFFHGPKETPPTRRCTLRPLSRARARDADPA